LQSQKAIKLRFSQYKKEIGIGITVIDTAPKEIERMRKEKLDEVIEFAKENGVDFWYCS